MTVASSIIDTLETRHTSDYGNFVSDNIDLHKMHASMFSDFSISEIRNPKFENILEELLLNCVFLFHVNFDLMMSDVVKVISEILQNFHKMFLEYELTLIINLAETWLIVNVINLAYCLEK